MWTTDNIKAPHTQREMDEYPTCEVSRILWQIDDLIAEPHHNDTLGHLLDELLRQNGVKL